jgi:tetratricopeptide (TPR) repeat protein
VFYEEHADAGPRDVVKELRFEAERLQRDGHTEKARIALRRVRLLAGSANRPEQEAEALRGLASTYVQDGDQQQALQYLRQALDITRQHSPPPVVAYAMRVVAFAIAKTGDLDGAVAQLVEAYRFCQQHEDIERLRETACAFVDLAGKHDFIGRLPEMCMEHGLSANEVRHLVDEVQKWQDLHGYGDEPDPADEPDDES